MAGSPSDNALFTDLTEALAMACPMVCAAVIIEGVDSAGYIVGDPEAAKLLVTLDSVQATLADGIPRTEAPPFDTALAGGTYCTVVVTNFRCNGEAFENRIKLRADVTPACRLHRYRSMYP